MEVSKIYFLEGSKKSDVSNRALVFFDENLIRSGHIHVTNFPALIRNSILRLKVKIFF